MTIEEAVLVLKRYQGYEPMEDGNILKHSFDLTDETVDTLLSAIRTEPAGEPLTLEQLREMDGQKVLLYRMKSTEPLEPGTVKQNGDVIGDAGMLAYHELYLETWVAFTYPPANIDREVWVRVEDGLPADGEEVIAFAPKQKKTFVGYVQRGKHKYDKPITWFLCGAMGKAYCVTMAVSHWRKKPQEPVEEARAELEKRIGDAVNA